LKRQTKLVEFNLNKKLMEKPKIEEFCFLA
jgi:hypothetical protein